MHEQNAGNQFRLLNKYTLQNGADFVITGTNLKFERGTGYAVITETLDTDEDAVQGSYISYCINTALHVMISEAGVRGLQHPGIELSTEGEQGGQ